MSPIKNVTIAGATGNLGPAILKALLSSDAFKITVLTRLESKHTFPSNVTVKPVDYKSAASLTAALAGQDAVVSTLSSDALADQKTFIDAAIAAGVQRFIPSEFGSDTLNANTARLPVFGDKVAVQAYLKEKSAANPSFSYSLIINGGFLDWGLAVGFIVDVKGKKTTYKDGGDVLFSATSLATVGQAVVGTLLKPQETANRAVYVKDVDVTQKKLVSIAKKFVGEDGWVIDDVKSADLEKSSFESLGKGEVTMQVMINFIFRALFGEGYGGHFAKVDNELLGIKELDDAGLENLVKGVVGA